MRKMGSLFVFILGAPLLLVMMFFILYKLDVNPVKSFVLPKVLAASSGFEGLVFDLPKLSASITTADARTVILENYLRKYNSPLEEYARKMVEISDLHGLDYRLLVAIAQQESNLCKKIPPDSHNCWGFGIYGSLVTKFENYPQAFETVARTLRKQYLDKGLVTPEQIMAKYTPPSLEVGGAWAKGVNQFLIDLE